MEFDDRVLAIDLAIQFQENSKQVFHSIEEGIDSTKTQIIFAREYLKEVSISRDQLNYLVMEALHGGCKGHRAELYASKVARSLVALEGRDRVGVDDLKKGVELVIIPCSIVNKNPP